MGCAIRNLSSKQNVTSAILCPALHEHLTFISIPSQNWAKEIHSETFLSRFGRAVGLDSREEIAPSDSPIKATDFGLAMRHRAGEPPLKSRSGTPAYMAPEVIQQCYGLPADIWSAGTMMYQLLTGKAQWGGCCSSTRPRVHTRGTEIRE